MEDTKEKDLHSEDLDKVSGGAVFKIPCANCGRTTGGQNPIKSKSNPSTAWFCPDCAKHVSPETLDNDYEYYTWQEGPNTLGRWRKKQK